MFKRASQFAETIKLHRLDSAIGSPLTGLDKSALDAGRKGFWELLNMDVHFRLVYNKSPVLDLSCGDAQVNLPWLSGSELQTEVEVTTRARFLIDCRRTFILMQFFQLLENAKANPDPELLSKTEALCRDIESLYKEWEIVRDLRPVAGQHVFAVLTPGKIGRLG